MQYVTTFERRGIKKGREEGREEGLLQNAREAVVEILQVRFELLPESLVETINTIDDLAFLKHLHRRAVMIDSLDEFAAIMTRQEQDSKKVRR